MLRLRWMAVAAALFLASPMVARAADLTIGMAGDNSSIDPQWIIASRNWTINHHIFEPIVRRGNDGAVEPWLAASWKLIDETTWEFKLRTDVRWHDGSPFTADDVVFSYHRANHVPSSPNPFTVNTKYFDKVAAIDSHTLRITTKGPAPALLQDLTYLLVVSRKSGEAASTADYNTGKAAIGTGAYRFVSFSLNDRTVVERNPDYWGEKQPWDRVTFRVLNNDSSRIAALLAGDVDIIESAPTADLERLKADHRVSVFSKPTGRVTYLGFDIGDEALASARIQRVDGRPLASNPLADKRVREALKLAVDLEQFTTRLYQNEAIATGQYILPGVYGFDPALKPWQPDMQRARRLLEEAGWTNAFKITLGVSEGVFQNAVKTAQGIAQAWSRIGVATDVVAMPYPVFLEQRNARKLPVQLMTRQNSSLVADTFYAPVIHSPSAVRGESGLGNSNFTRYSNPAVDRLIKAAMVTMDDGIREKLYLEAGRIAVDDAQVIPLWMLNEATATRAGIKFVPRFDRSIFAMNAQPSGK